MTGIVRILTYGRRTLYQSRLKDNALKCRVYRVHGGEMTVGNGRSFCRMTVGNAYLLPNACCGSQEAPFSEGQFFDLSNISFIPAEPILFPQPACFPLTEHPVLQNVLDCFDRFAETYSEQMTPENLGITPHRYQMLCRLSVAEELLRNGAGVTEAAAGCGFDDLSRFSRAFRKAFGQPPSEVRSGAGNVIRS